MKNWKFLLNDFSKEQYDFFTERTKSHISKVQKYCKLLEDKFEEFDGLYEKSLDHDKNKYEEPSLTPYVHITWMYKMKKEGKDYKIPENIDITEATQYHVKSNDHHPDYWTSELNTINPNDRDKALKLIDSSNMPNLAIAEMCADWCAMSEEMNNSPITWFENVKTNRYKFTDQQEELIYKILNVVW